jgi:hypothetical protein
VEVDITRHYAREKRRDSQIHPEPEHPAPQYQETPLPSPHHVHVRFNIQLPENSCKKHVSFCTVKIKDLKEQEFDFVIEQFIKELLILKSDERMLLDIPHRSGFHVHGKLVTFCAKTKGAHKIGGFMSSSA